MWEYIHMLCKPSKANLCLGWALGLEDANCTVSWTWADRHIYFIKFIKLHDCVLFFIYSSLHYSLLLKKQSTFTNTKPASGPFGVICTTWRGCPEWTAAAEVRQPAGCCLDANGCVWFLLCPHEGTVTPLGVRARPAQVTQLPLQDKARAGCNQSLCSSPHPATSEHRC